MLTEALYCTFLASYPAQVVGAWVNLNNVQEVASRMNTNIQDELELIKKNVLQNISAEAIYLFGSYAYGIPNDESDLDIYVVVPDDAKDLSEIQADIRELLWKKKSVPLDLLIGRSSVFNRRKNGPTLERTIAQKGTLLYES